VERIRQVWVNAVEGLSATGGLPSVADQHLVWATAWNTCKDLIESFCVEAQI
jgi:hypothetical protein